MANKVVLEQKVDPFKNLSPVLNPLLDGLTTFGNNFSVVAGTLIDFFTVTKIFLQAIRNPLAGPLLNTIDALIAVLEDLRDIGVGNTTVWPWEFGEYPPNVDTSKLDSAITSLVANLEGLDPKLYRFSDDGNIVKTKNGSQLIEPGQELGSFGVSNISKSSVYSSLLSLRNFFHPETWTGKTPSPGDDDWVDDLQDAVKETINYTRKNLIVKELTPKEAVDKVVQSLRSSSPDSSRPTGSGEYQAFVMLFAMPTINGVLQIVQSFVDYFGAVIGDEFVQNFGKKSAGKNNDEETEVLNLGYPLLKTEYLGVSADEAFYNFEDLKSRQVLNGTYNENGVIEKQSGFISIDPATGQQSATGAEDDQEDILYRTIPVFKKGDIISQSTPAGFQIFSAEVVEHFPIEIENGIVIQNRVKVKSIRGNLQTSTGTNTAPPVRLLFRENTDPELKDWPIFKSTREAEKAAQISDSFFASVFDSDSELSEIIPNDVVGAQIRSTIARGNPSVWKYQIDVILNNDGGFASKIVSSYLQFFRKLSKGMIVRHEFIQPFDLSKSGMREYYDKSILTDSKFRFNYGKLIDLIPSVGVAYHIAKVNNGEKDLEDFSSLKTDDLFDLDDTDRIVGIKPLTIQLGFKNFDGSYNTDSFINDFIDVPGESVRSHETTVGGNPIPPFELYASAKDLVPTWKFIRIQDLFPIYGDVIGKAISEVQGFRDQVEGLLKGVDRLIKFLERQIKAIQDLNNAIQQLIALFSQGLRGAGIYSGSFSGRGVNDFIQKLQSMQLKKSADAEKLKEITLETVEIQSRTTDPFTGLEKTETKKILRPTAKVVDEDTPADDLPKPLSAFDQLKYSGMVVFYAQGPDTQKFQTFMDNFSGLRALGAGLLANAFGVGDSITDKLRPKVFEIQAKNDSGEFVNLEQLGSIDTSGTIRIVFTNEGHSLNDAEREAIEDQMERGVEFFPKIEKGSATFSSFSENVVADTSGDSIVLFQGEYDPDKKTDERFTDGVFFELETPPEFSSSGGGTERGFFNIDIKTKDPLPRSEVRYKLLIKPSILSTEGLPAFSFLFDVGFTINPIKVASGSLI